jgi:hypothetical protein
VEASTFFPSFLWVLRDFSLSLDTTEDGSGAATTAREYMEGCLAAQSGFSTDVQARNRIRRVLTGFFKVRVARGGAVGWRCGAPRVFAQLRVHARRSGTA